MQLTFVLSPAILDEYQRVIDKLSQKFENIDVSNILQLLETHAILSADFTLPEPVSIDPDDDKFIACAVSTKVKTIVSGDSDLLNVSGYAKIHVLKPKVFIDTYLKI